MGDQVLEAEAGQPMTTMATMMSVASCAAQREGRAEVAARRAAMLTRKLRTSRYAEQIACEDRNAVIIIMTIIMTRMMTCMGHTAASAATKGSQTRMRHPRHGMVAPFAEEAIEAIEVIEVIEVMGETSAAAAAGIPTRTPATMMAREMPRKALATATAHLRPRL